MSETEKQLSERRERAIHRNRTATPPAMASPIVSSQGYAQQLAADFNKQIIKLGEELKNMKVEIRSDISKLGAENLKEELSKLSNEIKLFKSSNEKLIKEIETLKTEKLELNQKVFKVVEENKKLNNEIVKVKSSLNLINQHALSNNIEIGNIPKKKNENPRTIANEILSNLNMIPENHQIVSIYRKGGNPDSSGVPRPIIIKFANKNSRDQVLKNSRKTTLQTKSTQEVVEIIKKTSTSTSADKSLKYIYVSEHLTAATKFIYKKARDLKKEKLIHFAWIRNGLIFIKKGAESPPIMINTIDQLNEYQ